MSESVEPGLQKPVEEVVKAPEEAPRTHIAEAPARLVGSPLPVGSGGAPAPPLPAPSDPVARPYVPPPPPGRALANAPHISPMDVPTGVQKALSAVRTALPWVQRILPLLDGNIGAVVSNMLAPSPQAQQHSHQPTHVSVDLAPIEDGMAQLQTRQGELQIEQRNLRTQIVEQNASLKRVEDHLESVREATDRNTLEQQELIEDLKSVGHKVNLFALIALGLLAISVLTNIFLYLHIMRVLP